jgi:hypothetical protein
MTKRLRRGIGNDELDKALSASRRHAAFADGAAADDDQIQRELHDIIVRAARINDASHDDLGPGTGRLMPGRPAGRIAVSAVVVGTLVFLAIEFLPRIHFSASAVQASIVVAGGTVAVWISAILGQFTMSVGMLRREVDADRPALHRRMARMLRLRLLGDKPNERFMNPAAEERGQIAD